MVFNPEESIDLQGNTGPFIQYTYARIKSLLSKASSITDGEIDWKNLPEEAPARSMIKTLESYSEIVHAAAESYSPAMIANYMYELAKDYNSYYHDYPVLKEENLALAVLRLKIAGKTGETLAKCGKLLGIEMPERM